MPLPDKKDLQSKEAKEAFTYITRKQKTFLHNYIVHKDKVRAAKEAGYKGQSLTKAADNILAKPHIKTYLDELDKQTAERNQVKLDYFVLNLKDIIEFEHIEEVAGKDGKKSKKIRVREKTTDRIAALALLAKLTGHLKDTSMESKQQVMIIHKGLQD